MKTTSNQERVALQRSLEQQVAVAACYWSPVIGVLCWILAARYLLFVAYLNPIPSETDWAQSLWWRPALVIGACGLLIPWMWRAGIRLSDRLAKSRFHKLPVAALLAVVWVSIFCVLVSLPRGRWFFVEWVKVRTPNPSFARNTLYWESREFEQSPQARDKFHVGLVGSSQIYQGTDLDVLAKSAPDFMFEKNCLAGFGPMQYPWLEDRLFERQPDLLVCWVSEFDFFREDQLPVNRLRWAATLGGCNDLWCSVDRPPIDWRKRMSRLLVGENWADGVDDQWELRSEYADLLLASSVPVWRNRDHLRRVAFNYWWNVSVPVVHTGSTGEPQLAHSADMAAATESLRLSVGRKRLVNGNFRAFALFARNLRDRGIELLVCEGCSHPAVMNVYDQGLRIETRTRLRQLSESIGFTFVDESQLPRFSESDFVDPYHLGAEGRERFSRWLGGVLQSNANNGRIGTGLGVIVDRYEYNLP